MTALAWGGWLGFTIRPTRWIFAGLTLIIATRQRRTRRRARPSVSQGSMAGRWNKSTSRHSGAMKAAKLLVSCLENERVRFAFGIPGEENLDLMDSLRESSIRFVLTRHEEAAAFMADVQGRLTTHAGVCIATLGPGATNLVTGVADAFLDRAPLVAITAQANLARVHRESHQFVDILRLFDPITKWNARIESPDTVPEIVRKAFKLAEAEKPGSTHIELPENIADEEANAASRPLPIERIPNPSADRAHRLPTGGNLRALRPGSRGGRRDSDIPARPPGAGPEAPGGCMG